jgi:hypothetical protein
MTITLTTVQLENYIADLGFSMHGSRAIAACLEEREDELQESHEYDPCEIRGFFVEFNTAQEIVAEYGCNYGFNPAISEDTARNFLEEMDFSFLEELEDGAGYVVAHND